MFTHTNGDPPSSDPPLPHAARERTIVPASNTENNFFFIIFVLLFKALFMELLYQYKCT